MGIIESIALMPVCTGSFTGCRSTTPGALNSSGRVSDDSIGGPPSTGWPSGLTMRPISCLADRHARDAPRTTHRLPLLHVLPVSEQRRSDVVLLEVQRDADDAVVELEHLHGDGALEPVDAGDAVAHLEHSADLGEVGLDGEVFDALLEDRGDLFRA